MAWDFETDSEFQIALDWMDEFVREEVEPLDHVLGSPYDIANPGNRKIVPKLQASVKEQGLWACHLGPELGGQGFGQLKLALMNEILGRARFAPIVFGCQAPDTGNAEILAHYGQEHHKRQWLTPLLNGDIVSCYSMTEPHAGADPLEFTTRAELDGDEWVINGEKWFSSNARYATFLIVMVVTDPAAAPHNRMSMIIVPKNTPGVEIVRNVAVGMESEGHHAYVRYKDVRVPKENLLGQRGQGFVVAQTRLGGGRIHHAMRTMAQIRKSFDMMCERALSRRTKGEPLSDKQMTQEKIADSWIEMESFRLMVLRTAWRIDKYNDYRKVRKDIAAIKVMLPKVWHDVAARALQIHGSLGASQEMPFSEQVLGAFRLGIVDGPTEVHKITIARQVLRDYAPYTGLFPPGHLPAVRAHAREKYAQLVEHGVGNE
ncbi:MAG: acyl-CoA dehydrogenase [Gammaproteobacteria bacterium]|nr:acyl-CoA dehydrogenase [Gammaproteobacteria bacterium]